MRVTVNFYAAARAAAGVDSAVLDATPETTLGEFELSLASIHPALGEVLPRCSYLRDEIALCDRDAALGSCTTLDVLPPFAGG